MTNIASLNQQKVIKTIKTAKPFQLKQAAECKGIKTCTRSSSNRRPIIMGQRLTHTNLHTVMNSLTCIV